ncbi:hypothetical protein DY000_02061264 [Brassica cretica]|uniref:Uncharacterized protein n=1 Tax=Brassica cretica TaxID=69181 RepID=A0ABQ7ANQ0_BRACR|nr:hypothetical protein DY000_02061264 [Brassica cretica]
MRSEYHIFERHHFPNVGGDNGFSPDARGDSGFAPNAGGDTGLRGVNDRTCRRNMSVAIIKKVNSSLYAGRDTGLAAGFGQTGRGDRGFAFGFLRVGIADREAEETPGLPMGLIGPRKESASTPFGFYELGSPDNVYFPLELIAIY